MNSTDHRESPHPHTRPHHRVGFRTISSFDINALPSDALIRHSIFAHADHAASPVHSSFTRTGKRIAVGHSYSDSKIWPKRRELISNAGANALPSLCARIFKLVFILCLVLFLRALSGVGVRVPEKGHDTAMTIKAQNNRFEGTMENPIQVQHDYLAIDPDGHYSYTSTENDEYRVGHWRMWQKTDIEHTMPDSRVKPDADVDGIDFPKSTSDVAEDITSALQTPPPVPPTFTPRNSEAAFQNYPTTSTRSANDYTEVLLYDDHDDPGHEADEDLALRFFSPGDPAPVYPLRIHVPPFSDAGNHLVRGTRPGWGRKHGKLLL